MTDAPLALQAAIYTAITEDAGIMARVTGVHDYTPDMQALPYIEFGEIDALQWDSKTFTGFEHRVSLHVWSRSRSRKEAHEILGLLYELLHRATLSVDTHDLVLIVFDFRTTLYEPDGKTIQGIIRFKALTQAQ